MTSLSDDILIEIFKKLNNIDDCLHLGRCCRRFYALLDQNRRAIMRCVIVSCLITVIGILTWSACLSSSWPTLSGSMTWLWQGFVMTFLGRSPEPSVAIGSDRGNDRWDMKRWVGIRSPMAGWACPPSNHPPPRTTTLPTDIARPNFSNARAPTTLPTTPSSRKRALSIVRQNVAFLLLAP